MKKGQTWKDPETAIDIKIKSDRSSKGTYLMSINKPGFIPVIMRQKSLPTDEKNQDKMIQKMDGMLKKVAKKTQKKNENIESIHIMPSGKTFRISETISETKKKKIDSKPSSRRTKKRKVIGNRGTVFTVYGNKSRKRRRKTKRKKSRRKRKKRKTKKKRRRRKRRK